MEPAGPGDLAALGAAATEALSPTLLAGSAVASMGTAVGTDDAEDAFFRPSRSSNARAPRSLCGGVEVLRQGWGRRACGAAGSGTRYAAEQRHARKQDDTSTLCPCTALNQPGHSSQGRAAAPVTSGWPAAQLLPCLSNTSNPQPATHLRRAASSATSRLPGRAAPPTSALRHAAWCCWLPAALPSPVSRVQAAARRSMGGCSSWGKKEARRNSSDRSPLQAKGREWQVLQARQLQGLNRHFTAASRRCMQVDAGA